MDNTVFEKLFSENTPEKVDTEKCLTDYYKTKGYNIFKSAEFAQSNILNFVEYANSSILNANLANTASLFLFASKDIVRVNKAFYPVKKIHSNLLKMDWRDFEIISGTILEVCFGAKDVKVTKATSDGGLDFEGVLSIESKISSQPYGYIEVYGQSKKYAGNVGIYDIKFFVAFANSKKRNYIHPPQLFMFFTTSDYSQNSIAEMKVNGFIGLSGIQIANLIYLQREALIEKSDIIKKLIAS